MRTVDQVVAHGSLVMRSTVETQNAGMVLSIIGVPEASTFHRQALFGKKMHDSTGCCSHLPTDKSKNQMTQWSEHIYCPRIAARCKAPTLDGPVGRTSKCHTTRLPAAALPTPRPDGPNGALSTPVMHALVAWSRAVPAVLVSVLGWKRHTLPGAFSSSAVFCKNADWQDFG